MNISIENQMRSGMALRFREGLGFIGVHSGIQQIVDQAEAERLVKAHKLRIEGQDKWGAVHLVLNKQGGKA